jgi:hypothetical protein
MVSIFIREIKASPQSSPQGEGKRMAALVYNSNIGLEES